MIKSLIIWTEKCFKKPKSAGSVNKNKTCIFIYPHIWIKMVGAKKKTSEHKKILKLLLQLCFSTVQQHFQDARSAASGVTEEVNVYGSSALRQTGPSFWQTDEWRRRREERGEERVMAVFSQAFLGEEGARHHGRHHRHPHQQPLLETLLSQSALGRRVVAKDLSKMLLKGGRKQRERKGWLQIIIVPDERKLKHTRCRWHVCDFKWISYPVYLHCYVPSYLFHVLTLLLVKDKLTVNSLREFVFIIRRWDYCSSMLMLALH